MNNFAGLKDNFRQGDGYEKYQFFYHPDHLGSSSFITNTEGEVVQHIEYVPYGEVFIEERNNVWNSPYLFNAKEFDEETGLYYYGARYYEPELAMWYGVDALAEKNNNTSSFVYVLSNPIRYIDPDGNTEKERTAAINKAKEYKEKNPGNTYKLGNMGEPGEAVDCSGIVRKCIMASGLPDPTIGSKGDGQYNNGVSLIVNSASVKSIDEKNVRVGDVLTLDTGRGKGEDGKYDHIGIIVDIAKDGTISFIHSGGGGPKLGKYKNGGNNYWDSRVRGFYQWDTVENNETTTPYQNGNELPQFHQGPLPTFSDQLKESSIPIVRTLGEILSIIL